MGGLVLSAPLTSLIAILWLWFETKDPAKVSSLASSTLIFILPSFVFFIALPTLIAKEVSFYVSFGVSILLTLLAYAVFFKMQRA